MSKMKLTLCVVFSLCCVVALVVGTIESEVEQSESETTTKKPLDSEGLFGYFKTLEDKIRELEKSQEESKFSQAEMKEQIKSLKIEVAEMKNGTRQDHSVWLLTPRLRGPPGRKGEPGQIGTEAAPGQDGIKGEKRKKGETGLPDRQFVSDSCVLEEKWVPVHHQNNTSPSAVNVNVATTVGLSRSLQNPQSNSNSTNSTGILSAFQHAEMFSRIGKSNSTGFDWTATTLSFWMNETAPSKTYSCQAHSSCVLKQLVGQCGNVRVPVDKFCPIAFPIGSSIPENCEDSKFASCSALSEILSTKTPGSKKQIIYPDGKEAGLKVLCDFEVDGGVWTVIQKRSSGPRQEFNQTWDEYSNGFGSLNGNFWLGLENIRALTQNGNQELRIELEDFEGNKTYAKYSNFLISDASDFYRVTISGFSGTAGDSVTYSALGSIHILNGMRFSTKDKDNDLWWGSCVEEYGGGGWWFNACGPYSHLNGPYRQNRETSSAHHGIFWYSWKGGASLAKTEMKIRTRK